jgi:predicted nucleic acid-binding Zn ribbon protein
VRPIQQALPGALAEIMRAAPLSAGKVDFAWRAAVGSAVERVTAVRLEGRVLLVEATSTAWAREVIRSSPVILARLQTLLGKETVAAITVREP